MNQKCNLVFKEPNMNHQYRRLTGKIRGENCDYFVIELNPETNLHEVIVKDRTPLSVRPTRYHWYKKAEGSYDFCEGFIYGMYDDIKIQRRTDAKSIHSQYAHPMG